MGTESTFAEEFKELKSVVIRFAGDSGDGMQLTGDQFKSKAIAGVGVIFYVLLALRQKLPYMVSGLIIFIQTVQGCLLMINIIKYYYSTYI